MLQIVAGLVLGLLGLLGYQTVKKRSAEALLANNEMNKKLAAEDTKLAEEKGALETEELKRTTILASQKRVEGPESIDELTKFLNDTNNKDNK